MKYAYTIPLKQVTKSLTLLVLALLMTLFANQSIARAITFSDQASIINGTPYYDPKAELAVACNVQPQNAPGVPGVPGVLSTNVLQPWHGYITTAAPKYGAEANLVAAVLYWENRGWPDPNYAWQTSSAGAKGPMQFMPATWEGHGQDGNGDGVADPLNNEDAIHGGAEFLASMGGLAGTPLGDVNKPLTEGTLLRVAAAYNWGPGNVENASADRPLESLNSETRHYVEAIHMLISSGFTNEPNGPIEGSNPNAGTTPPPSNSHATNVGQGAVPNVNAAACTGQNSGANPGAVSNDVRERIVQVAQAELELWQGGSLGPGGDYQKYTNGGQGNWCAWFSSWVWNQAGVPMVEGNNGAVSYVPNMVNIGMEKKTFYYQDGTYVPKKGDMRIQGNDPVGNYNSWLGHVNIVTDVQPDGAGGYTITLIGGNQGSGGGGYTNSRVTTYSTTHTDDAWGYIVPGQGDGTGTTPPVIFEG